MPAVIFDPAAFKVRYPEFAAVSDPMLTACFTEAGLYLSNANNSPVQDIPRRTLLLNMLTAHVAYIGGALSADNMPKPVGRISNASEGSVSVGLEYLTPGSQAWFVQTQYGAAFFQATSSLRSFKYVSRPTVY
jgi:hypothetical protein